MSLSANSEKRKCGLNLMPKSSAWKDFERAIADLARKAGFTQAYRVLRGDDIGESDIDVEIPEVPAARVDCKYRQGGWSHHKIFVECEKKYVRKGQFLALPTKSGRQTGSFTTIRSEVFFELLAAKFTTQTKQPNEVGCPRCPGLASISYLDIGLAQCICQNCQLSFLMRREDLPKNVVESPQTLESLVVLLNEPQSQEPEQPSKKLRRKSKKVA